MAEAWSQRDPGRGIGLDGVLAGLRRAGQLQQVASSTDLAERVAQTLAERAPPGWGWSVKAAGANPTMGSTTAGVNLGNYIEVADLQAAVDSGAVLYDPGAPIGSRYRLNTVTNASGEAVMALPLQLIVGWRSAVVPTRMPGVPPLPVSVNLGRASETRTLLSGPIHAELLQALNAGLNNPLGVQFWHDAGTLSSRHVRQINFALPGMVPREGAYSLPKGWTRLEDQLLSEAQRRDPRAWATYTKATGTVGGSLFGIGGRVGFSTERVERVAPDHGPLIAQTYDLPAPGGALAVPSRVAPFTFSSGIQGQEGYTLLEVLPDDPAAMRVQGQYVQPDVQGRLIVHARDTIALPGSVLNALNGFAVEAGDVPRIIAFLRALDPAGTSVKGPAQRVFEVVSRVQVGQPLSAEGIGLIREAIGRHAQHQEN